MTDKGNIKKKLPPIISPKGREYDDKARLAQQTPGEPVLAATHITRGRYESIRTYRREPYFMPEGRIQMNIRNSRIESDGLRYGDVWFTYVPYEEESEATDGGTATG